MNVILIVFDSLRKDCLGVYGSPPWGQVFTPHLDAFARESLVMTKAFPNALPTLPTRIALYTGQQVYPFEKGDIRLKGDFVGAPGWGPIPEEWPTLSETFQSAGCRTALISDVYHMFKPSKNFWRGFDQWMFLRGKELDPQRSGPRLSQAEIDYWLPDEMREAETYSRTEFVQQVIMNMRGRTKEEDYFAPRVFKEAALWLEQNQDAGSFFLTIESFDPHEPWLVPAHYRRLYLAKEGREQVLSGYADTSKMDPALLERTQANYSGSVTLCDRWFGHLMETMRVLGLFDNTMVIVTSDHGHSIGDRNYLGKRGYPSVPEVYDIPLLVRFPGSQHAGHNANTLVQHVDITAAILEATDIKPPMAIDGRSFFKDALAGNPGPRDHVTIGWGSTPTVITNRWWLNCKFDGTGVLLRDLAAEDPFAANLATEHPTVVNELFSVAKEDAGGSFPGWLVELAKTDADAPGCSALVARA